MNKNDLVGVVADKATITKAQAAEAVDAVFEAITGSLKAGEEVRLVGFGTFAVSARKASTGRNPATGAEIQIPASNQAKFKPGKGLKDVVFGDLPHGWTGPFLVGTLAALGSGLLAIEWLLGYVRRHTYGVFVVYRLIVAGIVVLLIASGVRDATF